MNDTAWAPRGRAWVAGPARPIVSLTKNGKGLTAMWTGVALAVVLSVAVGVALSWIERDLPQAPQEAMESVIGAIAVCFVTGMILWMNTHARDMKHQLETEAGAALGAAGLYALASMAFLAVLKEGFETSVFLLATFSAAQSAAWAAAGAIVGLLLAVAIGWGIYAGGVRINLSRFFRATGLFLVLVAAGLVVTALRTAHEAGWLNAGQQPVLDLSWLVAPGTVRSALLTGVLGIPADPRLVEVMGWLAYLVPVLLLVFWPAARRPGPAVALRLRLLAAVSLAVLAALNRGRIPIGLSPQEHPGPFQARWTVRRALDVQAVAGHLANASERDTVVVALSGSGLLTPRTLAVGGTTGPGPQGWRVAPGHVQQVGQALRRFEAACAEQAFWARTLPAALLLAALLLAVQAWRRHRQCRRRLPGEAHSHSRGRPADDRSLSQGTLHAPR